jgi:uncharacterized protein (TIGR02246 family)
MRVNTGLMSVLTLWAMAGSALAQDQPTKTTNELERKADSQAIGDLNAAFVKAYNAKDAKAIGALFTPEAEIEDENGDITRGREAIVARFSGFFAGGESGTASITTDSLRILGADLAIEDGVVSIVSSPKAKPRTNRYTAIYARQGGQWLQARIRDEPSEEASAREHLQELSWMIGEWVNESDDAIVTTTCKWSRDGNYLLREFDVKIGDEVALSGHQRIAWDPQQKQFHLWVFDTGGGFGEGTISRDVDRWVIKAKGVRPDGKSVTATNVITLLNKDRLRWETLDRTLGGAAVPDTQQFFLVRKPPAPAR